MNSKFLDDVTHVKSSSKSLPERVADQIRQLIIDRHMEYGDQLPNEFELAQQLNVSRGSVREAVKLLVARNVLELRRGKGTFIADNTGVVDDPFGFAYLEDEPRLANELMDIRRQLEPWIAAKAAEQASDQDIAELRVLQHKVEELIQSGQDHLAADQQLHIRIADCTDNRVLHELVPVITYSVHLFGKLTQRRLLQETIDTHAQVIDAIAAHDPEAARKAMHEHLKHNRLSLTGASE
ncbi:MAG: FadR family transcriptional regulator [Oscillospiraceae bacterium]|nr:FadR family transcriptional regulator [Oscillospiraceae bacterium]